MRANAVHCAFVFANLLTQVGCESSLPPDVDRPSEGLVVALQSSIESDVTAVRFDIVGAEDTCDAIPIASETVTLLSSDAETSHPHMYATTLLLLAPGHYRVCASPLAGEAASLDCAPTDAVSTVVAEQTAELMLVSQCKGDTSGGVSTVVSLNKPPRIQKVTLGPSKLITVCETLKATAVATDPEGDELNYSWRLSQGSPDAQLRFDQANATLSGPAGSYLVELTVTDIHGGRAALSFPVLISSAVCSMPAAVHNIILAKCTPCHTTNPVPSAGMSLATPRAAYDSLVLYAVASSACNSRVRVIPGDADTSYLIAKLRGEPGICGQRMPRGRDPLPESEIAIISAWINDLPH